MICDNIMAGTYPNLVSATSSLVKDKGIAGFYTGWWPGIAGKIPSYGLTWTLFEQIKRVRASMFDRPAKDIENSIMGCMASATTVCVMIPMDTVKTRLVTQLNYPDLVPCKGIHDCFQRVLKEEGVGVFYRGLTPRLLSVVPMIGIQFGFYEATKKFFLAKGGKASVEPDVAVCRRPSLHGGRKLRRRRGPKSKRCSRRWRWKLPRMTTSHSQPERIQDNILNMLADWLATGIDPNRATIVLQSIIPEHAQLALLFSMLTSVSRLERVPTYKEQIKELNV